MFFNWSPPDFNHYDPPFPYRKRKETPRYYSRHDDLEQSPPGSREYEPPAPGEVPESELYKDIRAFPECVDWEYPKVHYFSEVGLECYNLQKGTGYQFPRGVELKCRAGIFVAILRNSTCEFETRVGRDEGSLRLILTLSSLKPESEVEGDVCGFGTQSEELDDSFKGPMPSQWPYGPLPRGQERKFHVIEGSELEEYKELFNLYAELALLSHWESIRQVEWVKPLEVDSVTVKTREDVEPKDKVKAENAIFYFVFKTRHGLSFYAAARRTSDGNPGRTSLEFNLRKI